jgi:hypothetical protein
MITRERPRARPSSCPDPDRHLEAIGTFADAGFDSVYVHQVGEDQEPFFELYGPRIIPELGSIASPGVASRAGSSRGHVSRPRASG